MLLASELHFWAGPLGVDKNGIDVRGNAWILSRSAMGHCAIALTKMATMLDSPQFAIGGGGTAVAPPVWTSSGPVA